MDAGQPANSFAARPDKACTKGHLHHREVTSESLEPLAQLEFLDFPR